MAANLSTSRATGPHSDVLHNLGRRDDGAVGHPPSSAYVFGARSLVPPECLIAKHYVALRPAGFGGHANCYVCVDQRTLGPVVLKQARDPTFRDPVTARRLESESRHLGLLRGQRTPKLLEIGQTSDDRIYIAIEYIPGVNGREFLLRHGPCGVDESLALIVQLATIVQQIHDAGIVHRDLKLENLMVRPDGELSVIDFGIARRIDDVERFTQTDHVVGSPRYMSPERLDTAGGPACDQFAVALIFIEFLVGPAVLNTDDPTIYLPALPLSTAQVNTLLRALAPDPAERFPTIEAFATSLKR